MLLTCIPIVNDTDSLNSIDFYRGIYETDPHFFQLFNHAGEQRLASALNQLAIDPSSDFYRPIVASMGQIVLGFLYAYPLKEMFSRQAHSLRQFMSFCENPRALRPALAALASSKGKFINNNSYYLARIYVMPNERGTSVGKLLMDFYEAKAISHGITALSLHVRCENTRAQRFYSRLGFEFSDSFASGYLSMEKLIS